MALLSKKRKAEIIDGKCSICGHDEFYAEEITSYTGDYDKDLKKVLLRGGSPEGVEVNCPNCLAEIEDVEVDFC